MGGWMRGWEDGMMGWWVLCMCAMMLVVFLFVGCADDCVDVIYSESQILMDFRWEFHVIHNFHIFIRRLV